MHLFQFETKCKIIWIQNLSLILTAPIRNQTKVRCRMYNSKYFKVILLSLSLVTALTAKANGPVRENVSPGPEEPIVESDSAQGPSHDSAAVETNSGILNISFDLGAVKSSSPVSDSIRNSIRDYLNEHPDCNDQKYRYCEVYLPAAPTSGNVQCADGYTFLSNDVIGLNIDSRTSPPKPKGMTGTQLEDLVRRHGSRAVLLGVCRKI